jgi:succinylglutamic semialdehyde dehydrogenase
MPHIMNPNTGQSISYTKTSIKDMDTAIEGVSLASDWALASHSKRLGYMKKFQRLLRMHQHDLMHAISTETGKPYWESFTEVHASINKIDATIAAYDYRCSYPVIKTQKKTTKTVVRPIGTIAVLGPFNFPLHIPNGQIIPALLTGNCVIVKPSEYSVCVGKLMDRLWGLCFSDIESPIAFVYGDGKVGKRLVCHKKIDMVCFTGSSATGKYIEDTCHKLRKPCALEMGGNNALIVEGKPSPHLVDHIIHSAFITAGQRCSCARRLILNSTHMPLIKELISKVKKISIAPYPTDIKPFMGPVVLPSIKTKLLTHQFSNTDSLLLSQDIGPGGLVSPRIDQANTLIDDEFFGPLLFIYVTDNFDASIDLVNESKYGLSCSVYTPSKRNFNHAFNAIKSGIVNWNNPTTGASGMASFGGLKWSGNLHPGGFNMIDHCVVPVASAESKRPEGLSV